MSWKNFYPEKSICYAIENLFCLARLKKIFLEDEIYVRKSDEKIIACDAFEIKKSCALEDNFLSMLTYKYMHSKQEF